MVGLQDRAKTFLTLNENECKVILFRAVLGHFYWSIHHKIYTQCKEQLKLCRKLTTGKNGMLKAMHIKCN